MPISFPPASTRAPPELPGLIAASVWRRPSRTRHLRLDRAVEARDDALGHGRAAGEAEREPDCENAVPEPELGRATEKNGDEIRASNANDGEIALGCGADHRARDGLRVTPVVEGDRERAGPPHDMVVRHDHPPAIDDDARRLTLAPVEPDRLHVDDPRQDARDDISCTRASRSRRRSRRRGRGRRDRRGRRRRRCALLRVTAAARNDQAERRYGDERGPVHGRR